MFRFGLEKVLRYRQRQVDARGRDVGAAERELVCREEELRLAVLEVEAHSQKVADGRSGRLDSGRLQRESAWKSVLERDRARCEEFRNEAHREVDAAQARLKEAWQEREVLARLRERQHQQWRQDERRRRQHEQDEIGSIRAALNLKQGEVDGMCHLDACEGMRRS